MAMSSAMLCGDSSLWKHMIELGLFDDSYPQRLNACFQFLSAADAVSASPTSSGSPSSNILGSVTAVSAVSSSPATFTLKDLIQKGSFALTYLSIEVDKDSSFAIMDSFRLFDRSGRGIVHLEEFALGIIEKLLKLRKSTSILTDIAVSLLEVESRCTELATLLEKGNHPSHALKFKRFDLNLKALTTSICQEIRVLKSVNKLSALDSTLLVNIFQAALSRAISDIQSYFHIPANRISAVPLLGKPVSDDSMKESNVLPLPCAWIVTETIALQQEDFQHRNESRDVHNDHDISTFLSTIEDNRIARKTSHKNAHGAKSANGDWLSLLSDLHDGALPIDAEKLLNGGVAGDSGQLHLLQEALLSLNHFFNLKTSTNEQLPDEHAFDLYSTSQSKTVSASGNSVRDKHPAHSLSAIDVASRLKDYKALAGVDSTSSSPVATSTTAAQPLNNNLLLETVLAEDLFETQQILSRKQARLEILEMIQNKVMTSTDEQARELMSAVDQEEAQDRAGTDCDSAANSAFVRDDSATRATDVTAGSIPSALSSPSFETILQELSSLGMALSERSNSSFPLGLMLEHPIAIVDVPIANEADVPPTDQLMQSMHGITQRIHEDLAKRLEAVKIKESIVVALQQKDIQLSEWRTRMEQVEFDRNEFMAISLELQVLREKNQKVVRDDVNKKLLETQTQELQRKVQMLEDALQRAHDDKKTVKSGTSDAHPTSSSGSTSSSASNMQSEDIQKLQQQLQTLQSKLDALLQDNELNVKENQRLKTAMKVSEQRVKSALQDQMTLHHQLQEMEEDVVASKATITKLHRELEEQKALRSFKEDAERKLFELNKEISKRDVELTDMRENSSLANKYHSELITAERVIETLEQRLAEYSVELEKGAVALNQLESYREQLRVKTKENRDLSLQIHSLESQLKDVPFLSNRFQEISEELQECKIKVEKIPGLMAEIARLRGSSRASNKALTEQDKHLTHLKTRVKQLEKENALLKTDNRAMQDVESKLKEANQEIKRLMSLASEAAALKVGAKNAEEEKKIMEGQYKKMRKFMRQNAVGESALEEH